MKLANPLGPRAFQFQICGRLLSLRNENVIIDAIVKSFQAHTPKPYLMPVNRFFPELNSAQILEIPVGGRCYCVTCSPCGRYIAAGAGNDIVIADDITGDVRKRLKGHCDRVGCIRFAGTSQKIVSASDDMTVTVWEWEKSDQPILVLLGHSDRVHSFDLSSDDKWIVSGSWDCTVRLWNGLTGMQIGEFVQSSAVRCVALCPAGARVSIGLQDGTMKMLDRRTEDTVFEDTEAHMLAVLSVAFSSDGKRMATCSTDKSIRMWNAETWAGISSPVEGHTECVTSVAFSPDGHQLVSGSDDGTVGTVCLWDVAPSEPVGASSNILVLREKSLFTSDTIQGVTFTCDGERIVSGSNSGFVRIWDAKFASEEKHGSFGHSGVVDSVSISPDGLRVATGSRDATVRVWGAHTGTQIGIPLKGHTDWVSCVSFSPDGQHLVSGSWEGTLRLWDMLNCPQVGIPFEEHADCVSCVSFSRDGRRIVSGGLDNTVRLWNVGTREQIGDHLIGHSKWVTCVSESSDGRFVVFKDEENAEGEMMIWNRSSSAIFWRSKQHDIDANQIKNDEAERIIRSCGHNTPHLWPSCFEDYSAEIFCAGYYYIYSDIHGDKTLLGNLPSDCNHWQYDGVTKVFAAELASSGVAICMYVV